VSRRGKLYITGALVEEEEEEEEEGGGAFIMRDWYSDPGHGFTERQELLSLG